MSNIVDFPRLHDGDQSGPFLGFKASREDRGSDTVKIMESLNFEFIRSRYPELADLGGFGEAYAHHDPAGAAGKLRVFAERIVDNLTTRLRLTLPPHDADLFERMTTQDFENQIPEVVKAKLHALRKQGNRALHGQTLNPDTALWLVEEAYLLAAWFHVAVDKGAKEDCGSFRKPRPAADHRTDQALMRKVADQERRLEELIAERDRLAATLETSMAEGEENRARLEPALLQFQMSEEHTRRQLIDREIAAAGWKIGADGEQTEEVGQGVEVPEQPTETGLGYADYVLWDDDGKPLGVIEAKKTSKHAEAGQTQAKLYADGLEKKHGTRPVIFFTNGVDIWIWDDAQNLPPRKLHGYYSKDSLRYLHFQREEKHNLATVPLNEDIAGRLYQIDAIKRVLEQFRSNRRKSLIVMATGTGKTRVAVSLTEALFRSRWVRRVLFLCDRRELRKQADGVFQEFLGSEPRTIVSARTAGDRDKRIYLGTYPAMAKIFQSFDVGFFDLIIADESHRSIYHKYRHIFEYFDALQVGLTATPVNHINRNTFKMFGCQDQDPTAYYSFEEAIKDTPPCLVPFEVFSHTTQFLREGIKYKDLSEDQKEELEDQIEDAEDIAFEASQIDRQIFNKDTNREILKNLMEKGIRDATGTRPGKSIVFARNHNHAVLLHNLFDEMYPQYGGNFCRVIDNYDPRADELIDAFKLKESEPTIAISVDMLDTGIDVPEIVNLVFAKPLGSYVKFWQMIGRGTRLCLDLFGSGKDKKVFRIFDHWGNFEAFGEGFKEAEPTRQHSITERLFEARLQLAKTAVAVGDSDSLDLAAELMLGLIYVLDERSVPIRSKWRELRSVRDKETLRRLAPTTIALLSSEITPLMQWIDIERNQAAYYFDLLIAQTQVEFLKGSSEFEDLRGDIRNRVSRLPVNLSQVHQHLAVIQQVQDPAFWNTISVEKLEGIRESLRDVMRFVRSDSPTSAARVVDITEDEHLIETRELRVAEAGIDMAAFRARVDSVLNDHLESSPVLQKIRAGLPVSTDDLVQLRELLLQQHALDIRELVATLPETRRSLEVAIRSIIGLDAEAVGSVFSDFVHRHPELSSDQVRFLSLLKNHIGRYGSIELERLYESPFTTIHTDGVDGVFADESQVEDLLAVLARFDHPNLGQGASLE